MRTDSDGQLRTLDQDVIELWKQHGWTVEKVVVPRRYNKEDATTWIVVAAPTGKETSAAPTTPKSTKVGDVTV